MKTHILNDKIFEMEIQDLQFYNVVKDYKKRTTVPPYYDSKHEICHCSRCELRNRVNKGSENLHSNLNTINFLPTPLYSIQLQIWNSIWIPIDRAPLCFFLYILFLTLKSSQIWYDMIWNFMKTFITPIRNIFRALIYTNICMDKTSNLMC